MSGESFDFFGVFSKVFFFKFIFFLRLREQEREEEKNSLLFPLLLHKTKTTTKTPLTPRTTSVERSELLSEALSKEGIAHQLLNAKPEFVEREAEVVAQAGR